MTPEEEAHWRYQLELMTNWGHGYTMVGGLNAPPEEVIWLREEARYKSHLATVYLRHQAAQRGEQVM